MPSAWSNSSGRSSQAKHPPDMGSNCPEPFSCAALCCKRIQAAVYECFPCCQEPGSSCFRPRKLKHAGTTATGTNMGEQDSTKCWTGHSTGNITTFFTMQAPKPSPEPKQTGMGATNTWARTRGAAMGQSATWTTTQARWPNMGPTNGANPKPRWAAMGAAKRASPEPWCTGEWWMACRPTWPGLGQPRTSSPAHPAIPASSHRPAIHAGWQL